MRGPVKKIAIALLVTSLWTGCLLGAVGPREVRDEDIERGIPDTGRLLYAQHNAQTALWGNAPPNAAATTRTRQSAPPATQARHRTAPRAPAARPGWRRRRPCRRGGDGR